MNICSVELFLRKFLTGRGHFFLALAGSRLMPLIHNRHYGSVKCPLGDYHDFCACSRESQRPNECDRFMMRSLELSYYMILIEGMVVMQH
jgi:hypothetical protein